MLRSNRFKRVKGALEPGVQPERPTAVPLRSRRASRLGGRLAQTFGVKRRILRHWRIPAIMRVMDERGLDLTRLLPVQFARALYYLARRGNANAGIFADDGDDCVVRKKYSGRWNRKKTWHRCGRFRTSAKSRSDPIHHERSFAPVRQPARRTGAACAASKHAVKRRTSATRSNSCTES